MTRSKHFPTSARDNVTGAFQRTCQGCTACCVWLPIPAGHVCCQEKPRGVACPWLKEYGCGIYARRPLICQQFACTWLKCCDWPDHWRPDRSGLLCLTESVFSNISGSAVYELSPQRLSSDVGREIIKAVATISNFVICITVDGRRYHETGQRLEPPSTRPVKKPHFLEIWRKALRQQVRPKDHAIFGQRSHRR